MADLKELKLEVNTPARARSKTPRRKFIDSIAVLPFAAVSGDFETEMLCDGITEGVINALAAIPKLRVLARTTVYQYKNRDQNPLTVGDELNVRGILTGRVIQRQDHLNIQAELVDSMDGSQLWGEQYLRPISDVFSVQSDIAKQISETLRLKITGERNRRVTKQHTASSKAYQLYIKGRYHWNKRTTEALKNAIQYFQSAIDEDPLYALAYTGIADAWAMLGDNGIGTVTPREAFARARAATMKALELDDKLAEAYASLGHLDSHFGDWTSSRANSLKAIELRPSYASAYQWYSFTLMMTKRFEEAISQMQRALELDPLSLAIQSDTGVIEFFYGRYEKAIMEIQKALLLDPEFAVVHQFLGMAYEQMGQHQKALTCLQNAVDCREANNDTLGALGHAYASAGKPQEARQVLKQLQSLTQSGYVSSYAIALIHIALKETEEALKAMSKAYDDCDGWLNFLGVDPRLNPVRNEPRFQQILRHMNLA